MRKIKTIDDITKDGKVEFGEGYEFVRQVSLLQHFDTVVPVILKLACSPRRGAQY